MDRYLENPYIGHPSQVWGVEEHRLVGGRGDGMRLLEVRNGRGLELTVSADRAADISRLRYRGINMGYFSPCGYVSPEYYDHSGDGFLKSFTAGFLTTCGLRAVGSPCIDEGEELPLHGSISNTPADDLSWQEQDGEIVIRARVADCRIFAPKLYLLREIRVSLEEDRFSVRDELVNAGDSVQPLELLYHMNMGYPLPDEDSVIRISSQEVRPRNAHAAEDIENWMRSERPQAGYEERCYYHTCRTGRAGVYQPKLGVSLDIEYDPKELPCFTQWKMMGVHDYVMGLEPGNCYPDGRDVMRREGMLQFIAPGQRRRFGFDVALGQEV